MASAYCRFPAGRDWKRFSPGNDLCGRIKRVLGRSRLVTSGQRGGDEAVSDHVGRSKPASPWDRALTRRRLLRNASAGALGLTWLATVAACGGGGSGDSSGPLSFVYLGTAEQQKSYNQ